MTPLRFAACLPLCAPACAAPVGPSVAVDAAFPMDLDQIDVTLTFDPDDGRLDGEATLTFAMKPGQTRALVHFRPGGGGAEDGLAALTDLTLDDAPVPLADVEVITLDGSDQDALALPGDLGPSTHRLTLRWVTDALPARGEEGWLRTDVDDSSGLGNETLWPTLNTPGALARHTVTVRVRGDAPYVGVGSRGLTRAEADDAQVFTLDTVEAVPSYTVLFAVAPADAVRTHRFDVGGVPVRVLSALDADDDAEAERITRRTLAALAADFGPLPVPSIDLVLVPWRLGMEYYAGTVTGVPALSHELTHLYWGTTAVEATWRDTWLDEAITTWWDLGGAAPLGPRFTSGIVGARTPVETGFDPRAYGAGARVVATLAEELGEAELLAFLADFHAANRLAPFTTAAFVDALVARTGDPSWRARFDAWVFADRG